MGAFSICNGQSLETASSKKETIKRDTTKQMNLLDEQTKMFSQIFEMAGATDAENPTGGATNYLDMLENFEGDPELKAHMREVYYLYDTSLNPTKKEELKIKVENMINEAMDKGLIEN